MTDRALAQLRWHNGRLGVMLVNEHNQRFFMFAEKLMALVAEPGGVKEVKVRDRQPNRAAGYYPGQVLGSLTHQGGNVTISLVVGEPYFNLVLPDGGGLPEEYFLKMAFTFPKRDITLLHDSANLMLSQLAEFEARLQSAEATPLLSIPRKTKPSKPS